MFIGISKGIRNPIRAMGAVFGDIGTSPLYTLAVLLILTKPEKEEFIGLVSLVIWTLTIIATMQYAWFAMNLSIRGEGGILVLAQIATSFTKNNKIRSFYRALSILGLSFMIGDGVITPAITILSSSEGVRLIPGFNNLPQWEVIFIAIFLTLFLFSVQSRGVGRIGDYFGPIMLIWFTSIGFIDLYHIVHVPEAIKALNPYYAAEFLINNPVRGFIALSEAVLVATGAEALYADMGHLGRVSIRRAWAFVFPMLLLNYLGQAAFILRLEDPTQLENAVFFESAKAILGDVFYIPFLILVILAGIIASQALISGVFSVVFQAINMRISPLLYIKHTSTEISTQIYIPVVNWLLFFGVILLYLSFKTSSNMAYAYGFTVTTAINITALFLVIIYAAKRQYFYMLGSIFLLFIDFVFFLSNITKITHGAY